MTICWYLSCFLSVRLGDAALGIWWLALGGYYVGAMDSCRVALVLCHTLSLIFLKPSVNVFAELPATMVSNLGFHVDIFIQASWV